MVMSGHVPPSARTHARRSISRPHDRPSDVHPATPWQRGAMIIKTFITTTCGDTRVSVRAYLRAGRAGEAGEPVAAAGPAPLEQERGRASAAAGSALRDGGVQGHSAVVPNPAASGRANAALARRISAPCLPLAKRSGGWRTLAPRFRFAVLPPSVSPSVLSLTPSFPPSTPRAQLRWAVSKRTAFMR